MKRKGAIHRSRGDRRRVAVITGTRADYGLLTSTMEAIARHPKLTLQTVVTGMHLLRAFGATVRRIERDGWRIDARVPMQRGGDDPLDQAAGLGRGVIRIASFLEQAGTDIVLVLGDRIEAMAGALAATTTGRFVAHIHGGDVAPGDIDDNLRHSLTKLAHIHLAATKNAARRIVRMGERAEHVHVVGAPGLDRLFAILGEPREVRNGDGVPCARAWGSVKECRSRKEDMILIVQHACGRSPAAERRTASAILRAVRECGMKAVAIYPNSDRGCSGVIDALNKEGSRSNGSASWLRVVRSLDRDTYLRLLIRSRVLVGNSSSGIIEAAVAGTAVVNVGPRQAGRWRELPSRRRVIDADESLSGIRIALSMALRQRPQIRCSTPCDDGQAGRRIARILAQTPLSESLRRKKNTF